MARVKRAVDAHKKRRAILEAAKGYRGQRSRLYRKAKEQVTRSLVYNYNDRRRAGATSVSCRIQRINAAARQNGMTYNRLIQGLKAANIEVDRKILGRARGQRRQRVRRSRRGRSEGPPERRQRPEGRLIQAPPSRYVNRTRRRTPSAGPVRCRSIPPPYAERLAADHGHPRTDLPALPARRRRPPAGPPQLPRQGAQVHRRSQAVREAAAHRGGDGEPTLIELFATPEAADRYADIIDAAHTAGARGHLAGDDVLADVSQTVAPRASSASAGSSTARSRRSWTRSPPWWPFWPTSATPGTPVRYCAAPTPPARTPWC
ncbi:hypothetical protein SMICM17S_06739 [Streptomyces microflavus]